MSWEPVTPIRYRDNSGVRAGVRLSSKNEGDRVVIALGTDVLKKTGWKRGDDLAVLRGRNEHRGKLRLSRGGGRGYRIQRVHVTKKGTETEGLRLALWDDLPRGRHRMAQCAWHYADGVLEITLPSWSRKVQPLAAAE